MTNGEKIKEIFPSIELYEKSHDAIQINFDSVWWNAEYKEPTTKTDCVSRQAVDRLVWEYLRKATDDNIAFYEHFLDLPSVTPKPKMGRWILCDGIRGKDNVEKCSCCGSHWKEAIIYRRDTQEYLRTRLLYCPNCGSRNEVEK